LLRENPLGPGRQHTRLDFMCARHCLALFCVALSDFHTLMRTKLSLKFFPTHAPFYKSGRECRRLLLSVGRQKTRLGGSRHTNPRYTNGQRISTSRTTKTDPDVPGPPDVGSCGLVLGKGAENAAGHHPVPVLLAEQLLRGEPRC